MGELRTAWTYPLMGTSATRRGPRTATPFGRAARITGINGNDEGGLRPSTGFRHVLDLDYGFGSEAALTADGGFIAGGQMTAFFPITFRVSDNKYAHGFVYEVVEPGLNKAVYRLKFKVGTEATWRTCHSLGFTKGLLGASSDYAGEQFHVQVFGRYVYCFRSTKQPFVFFVTEPTSGTYLLSVRTNTGGGTQPLLANPTANSLSCQEDRATVLTAMTPPTGVDAEARVIYCGFSSFDAVSTSGSGTPLQRNPFIPARGAGLLAIEGPSDLNLWGTPPQPDPSFVDFLPYLNNVPATPTFPFPATFGEYAGGKWESGARPDEVPMGQLAAQNFIWAYRLYDSRTGLLSPLSRRLVSRDDGYGACAFKVVNSGTVTSWDQITFPLFQIIYDNTKYDTLLLYRGRPQQSLNVEDVVMSLEGQVALADYHVDTQPVDTDWSVAAYFPTLNDLELNQQETFAGDDSYFAEMPHAGSALFYEATMLMGKMGEVDESLGGVGKFVWSSLSAISVELVAPSARYVLQIPDEEIERFLRLGPNALGLSRTSQYFIRREYNYLKAMPLHMGYGVVNARAAAEVGSDVYFVSPHGLQAITPDGAMSDIDALDYLIQQEWSSDLGSIQLAFDATTSCLFVLNPEKDHVACLWMRRGRLSEFIDVPFEHVAEGDVLGTGATPRLMKHAVFVHQEKIGDDSWRWRVYVFDYARTKGNPSLLQTGAGSKFMTTSVVAPKGTFSITSSNPWPADIGGCYLYVLTGNGAGEKVKIVRRVSDKTVETEVIPVDLAIGQRLGLSPVVVEWVGAQMDMRAEDGTSFAGMDFHAARHMDGIAVAFSNVVKPPSVLTTDARFQGFVYVGDSATRADARYPRGLSNEDVRSIEEGPSRYNVALSNPNDAATDGRTGIHGASLHPGVRIFIPDMDYRMLSVRVFGNVRSDDAIRVRSMS